MVMRRSAAGAVIVATMLAMGAGEAGSTPKDETPRAAGERVINRVLTTLRDKKLNKSERAAEVEKIVSENMDFETLARLSLGRPWRTLSDEQRKDYVAEFRQYVINTYRHTTDDYTDEDIKITKDRVETDGDATILTSIIGTQDNGSRGEIAKVDYRLRKRDGQWKIIDVIIDGVSLVSNFRSQFQEIIAKGNIEKLVQVLREKNAGSEKPK